MLYLRSTRNAGVLSSQAEYGTRILPALADQLGTETTGCRHQRPQAAASGWAVPGEPGPRAREDAAHRYADAGWHVFPAEPGGKRPSRPSTATSTPPPATSRSRTGGGPSRDPTSLSRPGRPGPDVLDVDKHKDGDGFAAFSKLKRAGLVRDPMAIVRTPSGGFHAYYRGTEHQRNGHIPGVYVDFRSQGGYVVAPPSTIAGRTYEVAQKQPSRGHVRLGRGEAGA